MRAKFGDLLEKEKNVREKTMVSLSFGVLLFQHHPKNYQLSSRVRETRWKNARADGSFFGDDVDDARVAFQISGPRFHISMVSY